MKTFSKTSLTLESAQRVVEAAIQKANELGMAIVVVIVDESGVLKTYARMDHAPLIAVDASRKKAFTAVGFGMATGESWHSFIKDDPILNDGVSSFKDFTLLGGGLPIMIDDKLVGAIGVSGGHYKQDEICAKAALSVIE